MRSGFLALVAALAALAASAVPASVVINPVAAPIAPGLSAGLSLIGQALPTPNNDGRGAHIQAVQPVRGIADRLFITDTTGLIERTGANGSAPGVFLDVRQLLPGFTNAPDPIQTGLMGAAFHPNFAGDPAKPGYGTLYVWASATPASGTPTYAGNGPVDHHTVLEEIRVFDPTAATASVVATREVLRVTEPERDHGAGTIAFNPNAAEGSADYGKLYLALGDGGGTGDPYDNAQDLKSPLGKVLRIDPAEATSGAAYTVPADNPFAKATDGTLGEVWAYGLRNPQQFSWDPDTGRMTIIDIGQAALEEVNRGIAGANYGWPAREGTFARGLKDDLDVYDSPSVDPAFTDPIAQYDHEEILRSGLVGLASIGGAFVYRGDLVPALDGMVILSDLVAGRVFYFPLDGTGRDDPAILSELQFELDGIPTSFQALESNAQAYGRVDLRLGTDAAGELLLFSKTRGDIYRLIAAAAPEPSTWAMMILGFGLVGMGLRRRGTTAAHA